MMIGKVRDRKFGPAARYWLAMTVLCAAAVLTSPVLAQDRPPLVPTRDVGVIYKLSTSSMDHSAQKLQATYVDGGQKIRLDFFRFAESKYPFATWIYNGALDRLIVVRPEKREYVEQKQFKGLIPGAWLTSDMTFEKQRIVAVAGQPCTNWAIKSAEPKVNGAIACVTDDGVVLRLTSPDTSAPPELEAVTVKYGSPPDNVFAPPSDFMRVTNWYN